MRERNSRTRTTKRAKEPPHPGLLPKEREWCRSQRDRRYLRPRHIGGGLVGELVEEGIVAFVGGPDGHVVAPGDAALCSLPEEFGVRMFGEFVEADVAAVNSHGLGVSGEGDDA